MLRLLINGVDTAGQLPTGIYGPAIWTLSVIVAGSAFALHGAGVRRLVTLPVDR